MIAELHGMSEFVEIPFEALNFACYCNEPAFVMSSELDDNPGKTLVTCRKYDQCDYGCNMWEWFKNDVPRRDWITDMDERMQRRLLNVSRTISLSMYKGRRSEGRPVCLCDKPCNFLGPSIVKQNSSGYFYVCGSYYEPTKERCRMKIKLGDSEEPNWAGILVVKMKTALDEELEAHASTKCMNDLLEDEIMRLKMENLTMKERTNK
ncbi:hypothetical protein ACFE04_002442 [Oxalis oulophora]